MKPTVQHPSSRRLIEADILKPGEPLKPDDRYASMNGHWEKNPGAKGRIQPGCKTVWVRP